MIQLGNQVEALVKQTRQSLLLVAPFIKVNTISRLLGQVDETIIVQVVTRWRADEIAVGVSDLDVYLLVREHPNRSLWLCSDLHAKYYRGDQQALVGSANLTNAGLGWSHYSNLEILIESSIIDDFEGQLLASSVLVDDTVYEHVKECVAVMPTFMTTKADKLLVNVDLSDEEILNVVSADAWLPMLRHPEKLYTAYLGKFDQFSAGARVAAISDLSVLDIPFGLDKEQFDAYVGVQLLQKPIIRQIDRFVETPQRFGAVRTFLKTLFGVSRENFDANISWQTLMRWLLHFLSQRYNMTVQKHSEIFYRTIR